MSSLTNFRKQFPQYDDLSDDKVLESLHQKSYSDLSREEFNQKFTQKFGDTIGAPKVPKPEWAKEYPDLYKAAVATRETLDLPAQFAGAIAGGALGTFAGPVGTGIGAGLGYGAAKEALEAADVFLGLKPGNTVQDRLLPAALNTTEGMAFEGIGSAVVPLVAKGAKGIGNFAGKVIDLGQHSLQKASTLAREAAGDSIGAIKNALKAAGPEITAAQSIAEAGINAPITQSLLKKAQEQLPEFFNSLMTKQAGESKNALAKLAGGDTLTAAKVSRKAAKKALNRQLIPELETILAKTAPVEISAITRAIDDIIKDPRMAGNNEVARVLQTVADDLAASAKNGTIDAVALDSIRKNSINSAVQKLMPGAESKSQKALAAKVLTQVKPLFIDAIENAGGAGYSNYLSKYAAGSQKISQAKLAANALSRFEKSPEKTFVDLVRGNAPKFVEKTFGPGRFNIEKEMAPEAMEILSGIASRSEAQKLLKEQANLGAPALKTLIDENVSSFTPQGILNTTKGVTGLGKQKEKTLSKKTLDILMQAAKSPQDYEKLLNTLPATERIKILKYLTQGNAATAHTANRAAGVTLNSLTPSIY